MKESCLGLVLYRLYRIPSRKRRCLIRKLTNKLEGGEFYSVTLRRIFKDTRVHNMAILGEIKPQVT